MQRTVLSLVLEEDALWQAIKNCEYLPPIVLILVLMEDGLWLYQTYTIAIRLLYNCYTIAIVLILVLVEDGLWQQESV